ncbi:MAG: glutathione-disulfide reductase [Burkholderiales bacterium]|nr:glutathione-disulfide reductase [Burkholderiales bacterium]
MPEFDLDLFVIGAGSGGVRASRVAAAHGARVAIAEDRDVGGTCVIRGCIPKKLFAYAAHFAEDFDDAAGYGWTVGRRRFDWSALIAAKDREIARLNGIYKQLLAKAGVELVEARATVVDPHTVSAGGRQMSARHILVATGGKPWRPPIPGAELGITSDEAFHLPRLPRRIVIEGGGYVAVEFAGIFHGLGAEVVVVYRGEPLLRGFDMDVRRHLTEELLKKGIDIRFKCEIASVERGARTPLVARCVSGDALDCDAVMFATGRKPGTAGLGLERLGVALDANGGVIVDEHSRTSVASIHAVGDVTGRPQLTPVAIKDGAKLAATLFGGKPSAVDHEAVPTAVFSQPPVATVGLTEEEARTRILDVQVHRSTFTPLKHTLTGRPERTLMKLVVDAGSGRVVGAHMVGADAPEIMQGVAIAVKLGATKAQFDATVGIHPTAAEEFVTMA